MIDDTDDMINLISKKKKNETIPSVNTSELKDSIGPIQLDAGPKIPSQIHKTQSPEPSYNEIEVEMGE